MNCFYNIINYVHNISKVIQQFVNRKSSSPFAFILETSFELKIAYLGIERGREIFMLFFM